MRAHVLPDARLRKLAGRFVRLEVNTEEAANAPFAERFPIDAWPTLLVIDPATEDVLLRWTGNATAEQVERLALDGERALRAGERSRADETLARADRLLGERRHDEAAALYREALAAGGKRWPGRERASEARVQALGFAGDPAACAAAAAEVLRAISPGPAHARVAATGLSCALELGPGPARDAALAAVQPIARRALGTPGLLADDRSQLYDVIVSAREAAGDRSDARNVARRWIEFLEREAARARTPVARSAFDGQRLEAAIRLGDPARALPALRASARDLPDEHFPQTNLATLHLELRQPAEALAAAERALALADGPRRVRVLVLRARAQRALGDLPGARGSLEQALRVGAELPGSLRPEGPLSAARQLLRELEPG